MLHCFYFPVPDYLRNFFDMWREDGWETPGNYGFDPLQFGSTICKTNQDKYTMQTVEIFNGRMAMLAMVGFAGKLLNISNCIIVLPSIFASLYSKIIF